MTYFGNLFTKIHKKHRAVMAGVVVFALFLQALAPLSAAWAFDSLASGDPQIVCTTNGIQVIVTGQDGQPIEPNEKVACPFCMLQAAPLLTPLEIDLTEKVDFPTEHHVVQPTVYIPSSIWANGPRPPRGPPLFV